MTSNISRRQLLRFGVGSAGLLIITPLVAACSTPSTPIGTSPTSAAPAAATTGSNPSTATAASSPAGAASTPAGPAPAAAGGGGTLKYARTTGPTSLDPQAVIVSGDVYTLNQIFEPLYITDVKGGLQPHLATGHTVSADGKTYTFAIRSGVKFSDGTALTAADVAFSILRNRDNNGPLSFLNAVITDAKASGPSDVVVTLKQPWAPLISDISAFANSIVPDKLQGKTPAAFFAAPDRHRAVRAEVLGQGRNGGAGPQPALLAVRAAVPGLGLLQHRQRRQPAGAATAGRPGRCHRFGTAGERRGRQEQRQADAGRRSPMVGRSAVLQREGGPVRRSPRAASDLAPGQPQADLPGRHLRHRAAG